MDELGRKRSSEIVYYVGKVFYQGDGLRAVGSLPQPPRRRDDEHHDSVLATFADRFQGVVHGQSPAQRPRERSTLTPRGHNICVPAPNIFAIGLALHARGYRRKATMALDPCRYFTGASTRAQLVLQILTSR